MADRNRELVPYNWSLVRERALSDDDSADVAAAEIVMTTMLLLLLLLAL